jgi:hypothetical protein
MGKVLTFYSYKGGTGRSMALANIAWILAATGLRVLVIDWDLEAPGLHRYFRPFLVDPELFETAGLIDALWELTTRAFTSGSPEAPALDVAKIDIEDFFEDYVCTLDWDFGPSGSIDFIGAGRQGGAYSERVNTFDWRRFYEFGGGRLLDRAKEFCIESYEFTLIDSRTGVSDTSGICTIQLPDALVACFTLNRQSIEGASAIIRSVREHRDTGGNEAAITFFPVAMRIENSEKEKLDQARARAREVFTPLLPRPEQGDARAYWDDMEVTYRPFYAYEEVLAVFGDTAGAAGSAKTLLSEMEVLTRRITGRKNLAAPEIPELSRQNVLAAYAFGPLTPRSRQDREPVTSEGDFLSNIFAKERRWRQGGFRYEDLLSDRELGLINDDDRMDFGRLMQFYYRNCTLFHVFRRRMIKYFFAVWGILVIFGIFEIVKSIVYGSAPLDIRTGAYLWRLIDIAPFAFLAVCFLIALVLITYSYISLSKPYGVTVADIFMMVLAGPFLPAARDYEPGSPHP